MSFINAVTSFFTISPSRAFGGVQLQPVISGYVTLSESSTDEIEITQQPVQQGANIADHAFKKPTGISIQMVFGAGGAVTDLLSGSKSLALPDIYQSLLALQNSLTPFGVSTPKRTYKNMMLSAIGVTTDRKSENTLAVTARFQQVLIVNISTVQVPPSKQKTPKKTQATQQVGQKSALLSIAQGIFPGSTGVSQ